MKYFFVLGNNPTLSVAEISAVFGLAQNKDTKCPVGHLVSKDVFILETKQEIDAQSLIKRLGGTIKIGEIKSEINKSRQKELKKEIIKLLKPSSGKPRPGEPGRGKFKFGFSYYGSAKLNLKSLAMETKKYLREKSVSSRWVTSREKTLSSVVVEQNKLTNKGIEVVLIENKGKILIGQTLAVQPFKELSFRDYGRPARDDKSGMLPPKLAQIMINLSAPSPLEGEGGGEVLLDPFCGSGTILTEAMLMFSSPSPLEGEGGGEVRLIGSDISPKAISDTKENIEWTIEKLKVKSKKLKVFKSNILSVSKFLKPNSVDIIVTEPYLGPQRGKINLKIVIPELEKLYSDSLREFKKILKPDGRIVMIFPVFRVLPNAYRITPNLSGFKIVNPIQENLRNNPNVNLTDRNTIIYGREGQKVWREIVVLE